MFASYTYDEEKEKERAKNVLYEFVQKTVKDELWYEGNDVCEFFINNNYGELDIYAMEIKNFKGFDIYFHGNFDADEPVINNSTLSVSKHCVDGDSSIPIVHKSIPHDEVLQCTEEDYDFNAMLMNDIDSRIFHEYSFILRAIIIKYLPHITITPNGLQFKREELDEQ